MLLALSAEACTTPPAPNEDDDGVTPACTAPFLTCSGVCIDPAIHPLHCGQCNNACGLGATCADQECTCKETLEYCATGCADLTSDSLNCGSCGRACTGGSKCSQGECIRDCRPGETDCAGSCVPAAQFATDPLHCGSCAVACRTGEECVAGECACPEGQQCDEHSAPATGGGTHSGSSGGASNGTGGAHRATGGASGGENPDGGAPAGGAGATGGSLPGAGGSDAGGGGVPGSGGADSTGGVPGDGGAGTGGSSSGGASSGGTGSGGVSSGGTGGASAGGGTSAGGGAGGNSGVGYIERGEWAGYAWTFASEASTITPENFASAGDFPLCAQGSLAPAESEVAYVGWNVAQDLVSEELLMVGPTDDGIHVEIENTAGTPLRLYLHAVDAEGSLERNWCAFLPAEGGFIPYEDFNTRCWNPSAGDAYSGEVFSQVAIAIPGTTTIRDFELCVGDIREGSL